MPDPMSEQQVEQIVGNLDDYEDKIDLRVAYWLRSPRTRQPRLTEPMRIVSPAKRSPGDYEAVYDPPLEDDDAWRNEDTWRIPIEQIRAGSWQVLETAPPSEELRD